MNFHIILFVRYPGTPADTRAFDGIVTCMSLYSEIKTYEAMYGNTMPFCKFQD